MPPSGSQQVSATFQTSGTKARLVLGLGFRVQGVQGSGFRVSGLGFRVQGSGFRVQGSGFRVRGLGHPSSRAN